MDFLDEYHRSDVPFSVQNFRECMMKVYIITGGVNLGHLVKVMFAIFFSL